VTYLLTAVLFLTIGYTIGFLMKPADNTMKESRNA
jgi:hypothetical protein